MAKLVKTLVEMEGSWKEVEVLVEEDELAPWSADAQLSIVGSPKPRVDGFDRVTGSAKYTYDIQLPRMLYGKILRCPYPHARIVKIITSKAEELPGVEAIMTHLNAPKIPWHNDSFLFDTTLRYQGEEVAAVAASDEETAADALDLIEVEYEELPFVIDPEIAIKPDAPKVREGGNIADEGNVYQRGDIEKGLAEADVIVEDTYRTAVALHNCLETHGSVAAWNGDFLTIWDSTQHIFGVRSDVAGALKIPLNKVRVIKQYMGGGFGSKNSAGKYTVIAALLAKQTGQPVKIMLDREEENIVAGNRPSTVQYLKAGAKKDGTLTALYLKSIIGIGAYAWGGSCGGPLKELYKCENVKTEEYPVYTNTNPSCAFRAPGYVEGIFALESLMDQLAEELKIDPLDLRLKNYSERDPIRDRPYSSKNLRDSYMRGAEKIGWKNREEIKGNGTKKRGIGMASQIWGGGGGPPSYAIIKLNTDGTATVISGTQDIGTGTRTTMTQIAAEELGMRVEDVNIVIGDTQMCPYAVLSAGSMTTPSVGPAVRAAAADAKRQLLDIASTMLDLPIDKLDTRDGEVVAKDSNKKLSIRDVTAKLGNYMIIGKGSRGPNPPDHNVNTFGVQFAEVEVDTETGEVRVTKVVAAHECGRVINPLTFSSQIEGGVIQGVGYGVLEQRTLNSATGIMDNPNLIDYKIPTALDIPEIDVLQVDQVDPVSNNLGCKGLGEPPIIPTAPAIANAVYNAIGVRVKELPITPDKILGGKPK